jgi:hypothetical protein
MEKQVSFKSTQFQQLVVSDSKPREKEESNASPMMPYVDDTTAKAKVPRLNIVEGERNKRREKLAYDKLNNQSEMMISDESELIESSEDDNANQQFKLTLNGEKLETKEEIKTQEPEGSMNRDDIAHLLKKPEIPV